MGSTQSEERTMVFRRKKKNDTSNIKNRERCFFTCEKNDTSNQKPQRPGGVCEFPAKTPTFYRRLQLAAHFADVQRERFFLKCFSRKKKGNTCRKLEWNSFVCFAVDEENCREQAIQQRKGKNGTRRKLKLSFLSELLCLLFKLNV